MSLQFAVELMSSMYIPKLNHTQDLLSLKIVDYASLCRRVLHLYKKYSE